MEIREFTFNYDSTKDKPWFLKVYKEVDRQVEIDFYGTFTTQEEAAEAYLSAKAPQGEEEAQGVEE